MHGYSFHKRFLLSPFVPGAMEIQMLISFRKNCSHPYAVTLALLCLLGSFPHHARADADSQLRELMAQYATESKGLSRERRTEFFTFWEEQFKAGLAAVTTPSQMRLRMLDELGAIQKTLGKPQEAASTYATMTKEARKLEDLDSVVLGLDNAFEIAKARSDGEASEIGEEYIAAAALRAGKAESQTATEDYANALISVSVYLNRVVSDPDFAGDRDKSLERAIELLKSSVGLEHGGSTPKPTKLYWLANTYAAAGDKESAAKTYDQIAAMDQDNLSPLWMRKLQIEQLHQPGTLEYCNAIEDVLVDFEQSGEVDDYEITLRHLLGKGYHECGELEKASAVLSSLVGKSGDKHMNAYNLLLTADSQLELGQFDAAEDLYQQVIKMYPNSGSAPLAEGGLVRTENRRSAQEASSRRDEASSSRRNTAPLASRRTSSSILLFTIVNGVVICGLAAFVAYRRFVHGRER